MAAHFRTNTSGNITLMMGVLIVPILLGIGAAIDFGHANYVRTVLQGAADAAALAAGTSKDKSDAALQATVEQYLLANNADEVVKSITEVKQELDTERGTLTVSVAGTLDTSFMAIAGISSMEVGARSQVNVGSQALEIALVLDNTGSMSGSKIQNLKTAAKNLVTILEQESSSYADIKIGVVPFAEYVNIGMAQAGAAWLDTSTLGGAPWTGCVGSRPSPQDSQPGTSGSDYPAIAGVPCNVPLLPLTDNMTNVRSKIDNMVATGNTYIPMGMLWGWNLLDSAEPFTQGRSKAQLKAVQGRKALVVMTDGENTISPTYPLHDAFVPTVSNDKLAELCSNVKDDGIEVYTVSFMVPTVVIKDILTACATTPGQYFDADNSAELQAAFTQIARDLAAVRLTQ
jgi:Flp pilus assembly protein TadG